MSFIQLFIFFIVLPTMVVPLKKAAGSRKKHHIIIVIIIIKCFVEQVIIEFSSCFINTRTHTL